MRMSQTVQRLHPNRYLHPPLGHYLTAPISGASASRSALTPAPAALHAVDWVPSFERLLGPGSLLLAKGSAHLHLRKALNPSFWPSAMRAYLPQIQDIMQQAIDDWCSQGNVMGESPGAALHWQPSMSAMYSVCRRTWQCRACIQSSNSILGVHYLAAQQAQHMHLPLLDTPAVPCPIAGFQHKPLAFPSEQLQPLRAPASRPCCHEL